MDERAGSLVTPNDLHVETWKELTEILFFKTWNDNRGRFLSPYSYRGLRNKDYSLKTSFNRLGTKHANNEGHILRNFKKYSHPFVKNCVNDWEWLSLAQHHGLATRLLDWTFSPFIALHFAIDAENDMDKPAAIWCVNRQESKKYLPPKLSKFLKDENNPLVFTCDQLLNQAKDIKSLDNLSENQFLLFLEPPVLDERISNQYAHFSLLNSQTELLDKWLSERPELYFRIIIPPDLKWEIRDKLDQSNISERMLFPGLGGISKWLNRHYTPRPKLKNYL